MKASPPEIYDSWRSSTPEDDWPRAVTFQCEYCGHWDPLAEMRKGPDGARICRACEEEETPENQDDFLDR